MARRNKGRKLLGSVGLAAFLSLLLTLTVVASGGAAPAGDVSASAEGSAATGGVVSSGKVTQTAQQRTIAYWTEERMRSAKPMPLEKAAGPAPSGTLSTDTGSGMGQTIKGKNPISKEPASVSSFGPETAGYTYPFPFTRYAVDGSYLRPIYKAIGKLFFTQGSGNFVCSAASVVSSPNQIIYTAGHCVSNGAGTFSTNVLFVPARRLGVNTFGVFPSTQLWTTSAWHLNGDLTADLAAAVMGTNASGQTLQSRVGSLGFQYDASRIQHWDAFGYPAAGGFSGEAQITCHASHAVDDTAIPGSRDDPIGIGCDMTGGSSGGPWVTMMNRGSFINSVNSYKYISPAQPGAMYGPYFPLLANQVRCAAATGGSTTC